MNKSTKAVLLSALVIPGMGHFYLKKFISAGILIATASVAIYMVISKVLERAMQISDKILSGEVPPDISEITALLSKQASAFDAQLLNIATLVFLIIWFIAIVDAYRIASVEDRASRVNSGN